MYRPIILGIDPGITTGIAILDLNGKILSVYSEREAAKKDLIKIISDFGKPVVIASDVSPCPRSVKKFAKTFGSKIFSPEESLSVIEKQRLIRKFAENLKNHHEADSLAAGIKAWKNYRDLLDKIKNELGKRNLSGLFESVAIKIFGNESSNISEAIEESVENFKAQ